MIWHMQCLSVNVSCIKFRGYFPETTWDTRNRFFHKTQEPPEERESATSQKLILWKASATTACGFIKFSALLCVDITLPHTASHLTHIRCEWSIFCKTCTIFTFYAPNKTWNYFFQSNKDERGLLLKGSKERENVWHQSKRWTWDMQWIFSFLCYANFTRLNSLFSSTARFW